MHTSSFHHRFNRLLALLTIIILVVGAVEAQTVFYVTTTSDIGPGSLREALKRANQYPDHSIIQVRVNGTVVLNAALASIMHRLDIEGPPTGTFRIQRNTVASQFRIFEINAGVQVSMKDIEIAGGDAGLEDGGGIRNKGALTLERCLITGNTALRGGGIANSDKLTIIESTIEDNTSTISSSTNGGGGIFHSSGTVAQISRSTIALNRCWFGAGGGINAVAGSLTIQNSTISGNQGNDGGGINLQGASLTLVNVTITENLGIYAGGIDQYGPITIRNTIVAGNLVELTEPDWRNQASATITSGGGNLIGDNTGVSFPSSTMDAVGTSLSPINPNLGPLQNNGGFTHSHTPFTGSPAINGGINAGVSQFDQRGVERILGGTVDKGAVEYVQPSTPKIGLNPPSLVIKDAPYTKFASPSPFMSTTTTVDVTVKNLGTSTLTVAPPTIGGPDASQFSVPTDPLTLSPGEELTIPISYNPTKPSQDVNAEITIPTNDPEKPTVNVEVKASAYVNTTTLKIPTLTGVFSKAPIPGGSTASTINATTGGLAVDPMAKYLYATNKAAGAITRSKPDGSSPVNIVTGLNQPRDVTVDTYGRRLFWTESGRIGRSDLSGGLVSTFISGLPNAAAITIDPGRRVLYFVDNTFQIKYVSLRALAPVPVVLVTRPTAIIGLSIDLAKQRLYWTEKGTGSKLVSGDVALVGVAVRTPTTPGAGTQSGKGSSGMSSTTMELITDIVEQETGLENPSGVEVDEVNGLLYVTDEGPEGSDPEGSVLRTPLGQTGPLVLEEIASGLEGGGFPAVDIDGSMILVSPPENDYGTIAPGTPVVEAFEIMNVGSEDLLLNGFSITGPDAGDFSITSGDVPTLTLAPGESHTIEITFTPGGTGTKNAQLEIAGDPLNLAALQVPLTGTGMTSGEPEIVVTPLSHNFGNVELGSSSTTTITVENNGTEDLVVSSAAITGLNVSEFFIITGASGFTVPPAGNASIEVKFEPSSAPLASKSAALVITSNDPANGEITVPLSGRGIPAVAHPYVFLAGDKVVISGQLPSSGNIHANNKVDIKKGNPSTYTGNITSGGDVKVDRDNTIVGDVTGRRVDIDRNATVTGTVTTATLPAVSLPSVLVTAGTTDVTVGKNGSLTLAPGSYRNVKVNDGATLNLSAGAYHFAKLDVQKNASVLANITNGTVHVSVAGKMDFDKDVRLSTVPSGADGSRWFTLAGTQTGPLNIRNNAVVHASIIAPGADVNIMKEASLVGSICAKGIDIDKDGSFAMHTSVNSLTKRVEQPLTGGSVKEVPATFALGQNYPNPFNPSTIINFQIPAERAGWVTLKVYDVLGREVRTILNGEFSAGHHEVRFDASGLASGIYMYRLQAGGSVETKRMMLMK